LPYIYTSEIIDFGINEITKINMGGAKRRNFASLFFGKCPRGK
jgi:hypothetical protein